MCFQEAWQLFQMNGLPCPCKTWLAEPHKCEPGVAAESCSDVVGERMKRWLTLMSETPTSDKNIQSFQEVKDMERWGTTVYKLFFWGEVSSGFVFNLTGFVKYGVSGLVSQVVSTLPVLRTSVNKAKNILIVFFSFRPAHWATKKSKIYVFLHPNYTVRMNDSPAVAIVYW